MKNDTESGVTLLESLLVVVVLGSIVILLANIPNAIGLIQKSGHLSLAREIAAKELEDRRSVSYQNLVNDTVAVSDPRISTLFKGSGEVLVEDCSESICTNSEDVKHVKVTVSWEENSKMQQIILETLIGDGGLNQ